ncbi:MAG: thiamine-phosphate kinase [Deltaproteobacteria bacterium]|nr:thiamine-phosphate kinase [Deltaproteobacteria bacterium]
MDFEWSAIAQRAGVCDNPCVIHDELAMIQRLTRVLGRPGRRVKVGIGDDAAVVDSPRAPLIATVDTLVENVHFDLHYTNPRELGHKALAVNLSDIAAMGATPLYALISIGLKQEMGTFFVEELYEGIRRLARRFKVDVIGGNTVQSPTAVVINVTLLGAAKQPLLRSGARVGDRVCVTGFLGDSAAGLNVLKRLGRYEVPAVLKNCVQRHLIPTPRVKEALAIGRWVNAAIDLSDGLSTEIHHIAKASKVGAVIERANLPLSKSCRAAAVHLNMSGEKWALCGGEDYELLLTIPQKHLAKCRGALEKLGTPLIEIGTVTLAREGVKIQGEAGQRQELPAMGWNHFVRRGKR